MLYQQGDVLLTKISALPKGAQKRLGRVVLAEGEVTGHAHVATATRPEWTVELFEREGTLYLRTTGDAAITHEEHGAITVPPGVYQIGKVQEYDHFAEEAREVRD